MADIKDIAREMNLNWHDDESPPLPPPEPWRRRWGTSWLRTLVGTVVFALTLSLLAELLPLEHDGIIASGPYRGYTFAYASAFMIGAAAGYFLWVGTWADHLMARHGSLRTFLVVGGGAVAWGLLPSSLLMGYFGSAYLFVMLVAVLAAYSVENALVSNSFEKWKRSFRPF